MAQNLVVLGAGVSGLTTALLLARKNSGHGSHITIVAKHMPGDTDIEYASPWAGADFNPFTARRPSENNEELRIAQEFERVSWPEWAKLASDVPEAGVGFRRIIQYRRKKDAVRPPSEWLEPCWGIHEMPDFRMLEEDELPDGIDAGLSVTSICINVTIYLPWLVSQCLKYGVVFRRAIVQNILDAADLHHSGKKADVIINCTGLGSLRIGGIEDKKLCPVRGQLALVRNSPLQNPTMYSISGTDDGPEESSYIMHRPAAGGCVIGGCRQRDNWESQPDPSLAIRIMKRAIELDPSLVPEGRGIEALSVIRHTVGLRPQREGGLRVEKEVMESKDGKKVRVVHNYGHGGAGYEKSYGSAKAAIRLVEEALVAKL
ncbi:hypothetical protein M409DRAFT_65518 [Zasmidium cellare ATCC 36951]|uniref:FAD dependent oxidoreductase domain-containing protein n=1 Tax=Zasmidium cellare ATCC 36951 TaxID=1080233 RepID=A0A6A6CR62_ZASCE|nr:uncharacterized protein M409DRAFT_65518 [Zasmidium cellare ATCC 36951]KAF2168630.1 hypothetical protein M409DRAFT_65518 [Zasmidium cellare ATCC 36951]